MSNGNDDGPAPGDTDDPDIGDTIAGYRKFRETFERERALFTRLATDAQRPRLLWIGCSDSRVVPAQITSADPGELFEVRNIANVVPPAGSADRSVGAAIEYGVVHLGIDDIVVCGHTRCGGLAALHNGSDPHPSTCLGAWIDHTRPAHRLIDVATSVPQPDRERETAKAHVQFQLDNLLTYDVVRVRVQAGLLDLHAWLYDMDEGRLLAYDRPSGEWRPL